MAWTRWLPWRFVVSRLARAQGFLDPIVLMDRLERFAQPAEVAQPMELLRAGAILHARGLVNSRVIQHNLDWVWPYWVERQFDPADISFVPRAFSITHINLTHRNWTAIGLPDCPELPVVDPRGLLTPFLDGWSLDGWLLADDGRHLLPSRCRNADQTAELSDTGLAVATEIQADGLWLRGRAAMVEGAEGPTCRLELAAQADAPGWLVLALRPCNPEGISFVHRVELASDRRSWRLDGDRRVAFDRPAERHHVSDYRNGDVLIHLRDGTGPSAGRCEVGMATAAAMYRLDGDGRGSVTATVPVFAKPVSAKPFPPGPVPARPDSARPDSARPGSARSGSAQPVSAVPVRTVPWGEALAGTCRLDVPDGRIGFLYDMAVRSLVLHSPDDVWPGPFTYRRFWFRDAAFLLQAMLCAGLADRAERQLDRFASRQTAGGYFHSQQGEWDANGEALWAYERYHALTGRPAKPAWRKPVLDGARWILRKRVRGADDLPHAGLLPAGFSAEHLGPNDYYYWDDFWGVAGLRAAARLAVSWGDRTVAAGFERGAAEFARSVERSLATCAERLGRPAMPASPYRRLDAGAIGSLAAGYPLGLFGPGDERLLDTVAFLKDACFVRGGFFQDMIHSGINAYLTLHVAQVLLRAGDVRAFDSVDAVAALATPTGQWPEAIHPRTSGGCMGDGHHVWAAAEWLMMIRNCFIREEAGRLILASGIPSRWLAEGSRMRFGPAPTEFGTVTVAVSVADRTVTVSWQADWRGEPPPVEVRLPGRPVRSAGPGQSSVSLAVELA